MDISIAGSRTQLISELEDVLKELRQDKPVVAATIYGKTADRRRADVNIYFNNEDMDDEEEGILVDVDN